MRHGTNTPAAWGGDGEQVRTTNPRLLRQLTQRLHPQPPRRTLVSAWMYVNSGPFCTICTLSLQPLKVPVMNTCRGGQSNGAHTPVTNTSLYCCSPMRPGAWKAKPANTSAPTHPRSRITHSSRVRLHGEVAVVTRTGRHPPTTSQQQRRERVRPQPSKQRACVGASAAATMPRPTRTQTPQIYCKNSGSGMPTAARFLTARGSGQVGVLARR